MSLPGRYFSVRDLKLVNSLNAELLGDIIQTEVIIYKMAPAEMQINVYGETDPNTGKLYYPGIEITCLIDRADINTDYDDFGPDRNQAVVFKFREEMLKLVNLFPEVGDIIKFNERYHEIDNVVQEQFLGGVSEKSFSIIVNTHYSRLSKVSMVERQK
jgi:hypothetical protein